MGILSALVGDVEDAIGNVVKQAEQVSGMKDAVNSALQPIVGGAWTGKGEQRFEEVVQTELLKAVESLIESISGLGGGISGALDIIKEADALASAPVDAVEGAVDAVGDFLGL